MVQFLKTYKWKVVGVIVGATAGFAYWYFIGCTSGTCPIQSNWHISSLYGGLIGYVLPGSPKRNSKKEEQKSPEDIIK